MHRITLKYLNVFSLYLRDAIKQILDVTQGGGHISTKMFFKNGVLDHYGNLQIPDGKSYSSGCGQSQ